ncbi:hypothetical protein M0638_26335 [Roseomonas sp. NAR14]|uniref:Uncharacterized protein n=1 Tax=Roseomonas acroporae TaxID=2937791 RepID=A0A9X1YFS0_9PROT|nr:hypothetical protein [Roseomonas acroporae]MCK8787877.1 hypothetical protein [Roseomonas acroporae]
MRSMRRAGLGLLLLLPGLAAADPLPVKPPERRYADGERCRGMTALRIVNEAGVAVTELYLRPSGGTGGWGDDRLGEDTLPAGADLALDPGLGVWDVLLLRADGRAFLAMRQNACAINRLRLTAEGGVHVD